MSSLLALAHGAADAATMAALARNDPAAAASIMRREQTLKFVGLGLGIAIVGLVGFAIYKSSKNQPPKTEQQKS